MNVSPRIRIGTCVADMIALRNLTSKILGTSQAGRCPVFERIAAGAEMDRDAISARHRAACAKHNQRLWLGED